MSKAAGDECQEEYDERYIDDNATCSKECRVRRMEMGSSYDIAVLAL